MNRINWLDMLRGYALVCIMLDHMPVSVLSKATLTNFALFDAAELFVLLSGFLVGLVWTQVARRDGVRVAQKRFLWRSFQVWRAMVLGAVIMALLSALLLHLGLRHTAIWNEYANMVTEAPAVFAAAVGVMWMQPNLLDVLALYVVLIATVPLTMPVLSRWPVLFALASALLWTVAEPLNAMLPNQRREGGFLFNPFGWQVLFFAGAAIGMFRQQISQRLAPYARWITVASVIVLAYGLAYDMLARFGAPAKPLRDAMGGLLGPIDKWSLDEARFISIMAASWLAATVLSQPLERLADTTGGRALALIGRGGLWSFAVCVWLSVLGDAAQMLIPNEAAAMRFFVDVVVILALWAAAALWMNRESWIIHLTRRQRAS
ncbi:OpgC domain-containing protein [Paracoccus sp. M683]|uniref:OpgC domain-containing protein n=1 Tax=Paracoccus sp. M683 TaxID=2594268 RepID=UPI00117E559F|nr:OpgC domain-containing protein [Paracoccus sp. M683]TRW97785.1 OpgC domain-containing protein [Paracoccus sp. M683]